MKKNSIKPKAPRPSGESPAPSKPYWEMNLEELREATREFDEPFVMDKAEPLTPAMRAQWQRAKRKPGRPPKGAGAKVISLSIEQSLLERADALAKKQGLSRADLFARGIHAVLAVYAPPQPANA